MSKEKVSEIETHQETNAQPETLQKETDTNTTHSKIINDSFALIGESHRFGRQLQQY